MPRKPRRLRRTQHRDRLMAVVSETIALYHRLRWVAEQIYGEEGRSAAVRGVLRGIVRYGAQTVPMLARTRFVTRQYMQELVDKLIASGLAERTTNPRHRRSPLVRATARGEALVQRMDAIDERVLVAAVGPVAGDDLDVTERTLRAFRHGFEQGGRWQSLLPGLLDQVD
jgi:DNA-binding MarR family transcriptional regulator